MRRYWAAKKAADASKKPRKRAARKAAETAA
jgi:hypothetical protein